MSATKNINAEKIQGNLTANTINIQTLGAGASVNNLGIDANGNVVTGTTGGGIDGSGVANALTYWTDTDTVNGSTGFLVYDNPTNKTFVTSLDSGNYQEMYVTNSLSEFEMKSEGNTNRIRLNTYNNGANNDGTLEFFKYRGSASSPSGVTSSTVLGGINWYGGYQDGFSLSNKGAAIEAVALENWSSSSNATKLNFNVTRVSGTTPSAGLVLSGLDDRAKLDVFGDLYVNGQIEVRTKTNNAPTGTTFSFECGNGMAQKVDLNDASGNVTVSFDSPKNGSTYTLLVIQGTTPRNLTFPSGWWLNDGGAFDFSTELANDERAFVTITYLNSEYHYAVKKLTQV